MTSVELGDLWLVYMVYYYASGWEDLLRKEIWRRFDAKNLEKFLFGCISHQVICAFSKQVLFLFYFLSNGCLTFAHTYYIHYKQ